MKVSYQPPPRGTLPSFKDLIPISGIAPDISGTCEEREKEIAEEEKERTWPRVTRPLILVTN